MGPKPGRRKLVLRVRNREPRIQAQPLLPGRVTQKEAVPADQGPQSGIPRDSAQARESLRQGGTATSQVGLLIAQAKTASCSELGNRNWPLVRSVLGDGILRYFVPCRAAAS
jgi:hypothetical protein